MSLGRPAAALLKMSVTTEQTDDALFSTSFEASMNKESDLGIGWRRPFLYMHIYHIPIDLEGRLYRQGQRTTNTRPFPKSVMLFITGYLAKTRESLPVRGGSSLYFVSH
jgi:hypothetical protein